MKKFLLCAGLLVIVQHTVMAERTVKFEYQTSQARLLDVSPKTYVHPLTAELVVDSSKGRIRETWILSSEDYRARSIPENDEATLNNLRSYAVFKSSEKNDCDVIVAATFDIRINEQGAVITIAGYPANFANWRSAGVPDMQWINLERSSNQNQNKEKEEKKEKK